MNYQEVQEKQEIRKKRNQMERNQEEKKLTELSERLNRQLLAAPANTSVRAA